jgi:CRP-like cAMP-binding protein
MLRKDVKVELLRRAPLFARCSARQLRAIAAVADELYLPAGRELTREGATGVEFFVLAEGTAEVRRNGRRVNTLHAGDFLGEIALIVRGPRTATVTTTSPARVLVVTGRDFRRLLREMPPLQLTVLEALAERLPPDH